MAKRGEEFEPDIPLDGDVEDDDDVDDEDEDILAAGAGGEASSGKKRKRKGGRQRLTRERIVSVISSVVKNGWSFCVLD